MSRGRQLDGHFQAMFPRMVAKQRIAQDLIDGQMTLLEAAAHFRAADQQPPAFDWQAFRVSVQGQSDEERHCRTVVNYVFTTLADDPFLADTFRDRLQEELAEHLRCGTLVLPEVTSLLPGSAVLE